MEDSEGLLAGAAFYARLPSFGPEFQGFFYRLLHNSVVAATQRRLVGVLSASAEARYQEFLHLHPMPAQRLPRRHIAPHCDVSGHHAGFGEPDQGSAGAE